MITHENVNRIVSKIARTTVKAINFANIAVMETGLRSHSVLKLYNTKAIFYNSGTIFFLFRCNNVLPNYVVERHETTAKVSKKNLRTWLGGVMAKPRHHSINPSNKVRKCNLTCDIFFSVLVNFVGN